MSDGSSNITGPSMTADSLVYVAGHRGLVGSAILRKLQDSGLNTVVRTRNELDLTNVNAVDDFFKSERPTHVFLAAAKVGGIGANDALPAEFIHENLLIQSNVINSAWASGVEKLQFLGSSCIYPKLAPQPIREEYLLTGPLEPTNEWYAVAKIAGIKTCQAYRKQYGFDAISIMPTNLYGPGDNFDLENSHVLPALIRKFDEAKSQNLPEVEIWGTGSPLREFLYVDDLADAAVFLMQNYSGADIVNVGTGKDVSIADLAQMICRIVGFEGEIVFDTSRPDGTPRKLLDVSRLGDLGWKYRTELEEGVKETYLWYSNNKNAVRR